MCLEQCLTLDDEVVEQVSCLLGCHTHLSCRLAVETNNRFVLVFPSFLRFDEQRLPLLIRMVMGWGTYDVLAGALNDQQMTVLNARNELNISVPKLFIEVMREDGSVLCREISTIMRDDLAVTDTDNVQTQGKVFGCHVVADTGSLEWSAAFIHLVLVVAEDGAVGYFGAREKSVWNCHQASSATLASQHIHIRSICILQERLSTEALHGMVSHAIT